MNMIKHVEKMSTPAQTRPAVLKKPCFERNKRKYSGSVQSSWQGYFEIFWPNFSFGSTEENVIVLEQVNKIEIDKPMVKEETTDRKFEV